MQKTTLGGILAIVASSIGILTGLFSLVYLIFMTFIFGSFEEGLTYTASGDEAFVIMIWLIFGFVFLYHLGLGAVGIVGGICAIKKKAWGWALAGAIASSLMFYYVGIAAVVLVSMSRAEFNKPAVNMAGPRAAA